MAFSSPHPLYHLDPPNWHHQQRNQELEASFSDHEQNNNLNHQHHHHQLLQQTPPMPQMATTAASEGGGGTGSGLVRPASMAERARLAKLPQPETALNCPRCDSTNTKFCYFNNYSLSQPRHFCKTCRRYWTHGGALRNVPVGGGCRRNKRSTKSSRSSRSKSPTAAATSSTTTGSGTCDILSSHLPLPSQPQIPFHLPPLNHMMTDYGVGSAEIGLNFGGGPSGLMLSDGVLGNEPWRMQQFPFLVAAAASSYPLGSGEPSYVSDGTSNLSGSKRQLESGVTQQMATVKLEDSKNNNINNQRIGFGSSASSRNFLGMNNLGGGIWEQYSWMGGGGNPWNISNDLSGFASSSSSSTTHLL